MTNAYCPDCDTKLVINPSPAVGKKLTCLHCGAELEVVSIDPLELDWAYEEPDGDWDDDEDW